MSICSLFARLTRKVIVAAGIAVALWGTGSARAADVTAPTAPGVGVAAPVTVGGGPGCATCQHGVPSTSCNTCGKLLHGRNWLHKDKHAQYQVNLCPGACFGYFSTQWRKWDEVCPYPYVGRAGLEQSGPMALPLPGTGLGQPRPLDPKMMEPKKPGDPVPPISLPPAPAPAPVPDKF